jgi:predicted GH43/DUF377 family glycosyl hydrolase
MTDLRFEIYPAATPLSGLLATFDSDDYEEGTTYRVELNGTGSGKIVIHSSHADATPTVFADDNYVLVIDDDLGESIGGFFLREGDFTAVSSKEQAGRILSFGGPGSLAYLGNAMIGKTQLVTGSGIYEGPRDDGQWHFPNSRWGTVLHRWMTEAQDPDRPIQPVPDLTYDFTTLLDSAGAAWTAYLGDWTFSVGTNYVDMLPEFMRLGIVIWMRPELLLQAYEGPPASATPFGTDRSSATFAAGKVRFEHGVNIFVPPDVKQALHGSQRVKYLLVQGPDSRPSALVEIIDSGETIPREMLISRPGTEGADALEIQGNMEIALRQADLRQAVVGSKPGDDEANGLYTPGWPGGSGHYWVGDTVTLHTGTESRDFNEVDIKVAAITWQLRAGGEWGIVVELGSTFYSVSAPGGPSGVPYPPTSAMPCVCPHPPSGPYEAGDPAVTDYLWTFDANEKDTSNTYPVGTLATNWHAGYVHTHVTNPGVGNRTAGTKPPITPGTYHFRASFHRNPGTPYNPSGVYMTVYQVASGVQTLIGTTATTTSDSGFEDTIDVVVGAGGDHIVFELPFNSSTIQEVELSHGGSGDIFVGDDPPPAADDSVGSLGTDINCYALCDHKHAAQTAAVTSIADAGGYFDGANVEEALQELGAGPAGSAPETPFHEHDLPHGYSLTRRGIVIERGTSGSWKESLVESPNVFWSPQAGKYVMVFVGYSGTPASPTEGAIGHATAASPDGPWTEYVSNPFFSKSGAGADSNGCSGPFVWYEDGTYHLFYIGLTASGYEQGTKTICHATSTDWVPGTNAGTWTRHGSVISPSGAGWRSTAIWHPNIVKRRIYYLFFNATGSVTERIGFATSPDLTTWTVDDVNSPVLSEGAGGQWDDVHIGDPYVYRIGETWYMAYYAYDGSVSQDGYAVTSDADFPLGWTKFGGNPVLTPGSAGSYDESSAHKPSIWVTPTRLYHWYTAVSDSFTKREIGLATEDAPVAVPSDEDLQAAGHWEVVVSGSAPPVAVSTEADDDWVYGWVSA